MRPVEVIRARIAFHRARARAARALLARPSAIRLAPLAVSDVEGHAQAQELAAAALAWALGDRQRRGGRVMGTDGPYAEDLETEGWTRRVPTGRGPDA